MSAPTTQGKRHFLRLGFVAGFKDESYGEDLLSAPVFKDGIRIWESIVFATKATAMQAIFAAGKSNRRRFVRSYWLETSHPERWPKLQPISAEEMKEMHFID